MRRGKGRSYSSSVAFCYHLEVGEKVRDNFGRKCSKDKKYWDFSCIDRNKRVAPLQVSLPDIVITWDDVRGQLFFIYMRLNPSLNRRTSLAEIWGYKQNLFRGGYQYG